MRIAIATQNYFQPNNGQAVFVRRLAKGLALRGYPVTVITPSDRGAYHREESGDLSVEGIRSRTLAPFYSDVYVTLRPHAEVERLMGEFRPDVVILQDHYPLCRAVSRATIRHNLPSIGTNHFLPENLIPFVPVLSQFASTRALMERVMWRQVLDVFNPLDIATAPTETAAAILRRQNLRPPVYAVSCGIDLEAYFPDPDVDRPLMRRKYGLTPDGTLLLFVGRVDREKRLDVLIRALARLKRPDVQLAIGGKGRDLENMRKLAESLQLGDKVVFTGFIPAEDHCSLLNTADIFAMPSEAELQSIATLEAMACARPVLASDARALPELVENGVNGQTFRSGDDADAAAAIVKLVECREKWPAYGQASLKRAQAHSLPFTIDRYEQLLQEAVQLHNK
jgi:glycosyltransferase involved in cell wall biosynthesis